MPRWEDFRPDEGGDTPPPMTFLIRNALTGAPLFDLPVSAQSDDDWDSFTASEYAEGELHARGISVERVYQRTDYGDDGVMKAFVSDDEYDDEVDFPGGDDHAGVIDVIPNERVKEFRTGFGVGTFDTTPRRSLNN